MGTRRPPRLAVPVESLTATTDGGDHLTVTLYHLDRGGDPSQRAYWIEHVMRTTADGPIAWLHARQYGGQQAKTRVGAEWAEIRQALADHEGK